MANKIKLGRGTKTRIETVKNNLDDFEIVYATDTDEIGVKKTNGNIEYFYNKTQLDSMIGDIESALDDKLDKNNAITAGTKTKITYDAKGLVTSGDDLVATDIPNLDASKLTTGTLGVARGGTGATTFTSGDVLVGNGTSAVTTLSRSGIDSRTSFPPSAHNHDDRYYTESETDSLLSGKLNTTLKGAVNGVAELDNNGKVPSSQLPSYVDDVLEYANLSSFPTTGEAGKIYIAQDTNKTYRWSGSAYVEISASLALGETSSTAYRGDRGKTAYDHTSLTNNPHGVTTAQIGAEPAFSKNTAFNKNFGTSLNTVAQGNHLHTGVYEPANSNIQSHIGSTSNPHGVSKSQVGLGNVDNTSDVTKYVQGLRETRANVNTKIWTGTQAQYDAIGTKDATTLYFITE